MMVFVDDKVARMLVGKWEEALTADSCVALHAVLGSHAQATAEYDDPPRRRAQLFASTTTTFLCLPFLHSV